VAKKPKYTLSLARGKVCPGNGTKAKNRGEEDPNSKETNPGATRKSLRESTRSEQKRPSDNGYGHAGEKKDSQGANVEGEVEHKKSEIQHMDEKIQVTILRINATNPVERLRKNEPHQLAATT